MKRLDRLEKKMKKANINPMQTVTIYYIDNEEFTPKEIDNFTKEPSTQPKYYVSKIFTFFKEQGQDVKAKWGDPFPMEKRTFKKSYVKVNVSIEEAEKIYKDIDESKGRMFMFRGDF